MKKADDNNIVHTEQRFLKKYIVQKIFWTIIALLLVVAINMLINKYAGGYFNNIAQIYQFKAGNEFLLIVLVLGIVSSLCGFIAFLGGKYLHTAKIARIIVFQKKFKQYGDLFLKYGWVIIILAATTPLPFAMVCFISGYFKFSPVTFLKIVVPVRIVRFFISAYLIKYSIILL
ncbi:MAG: hypothetical protein FD136_682 [Chitinophagaceae bacterium]|nr:MAG: hypothetical protein FD136_682 [Chitinophagaceae bacterium]